jgi:lipoprotein-anchoring transpeptidase ErfK/SrfK
VAYILGGTGTISSAVASEVAGWPALPTITYPRPYEGAKARVSGTVGSNTTTVTLVVNGVVRGSRAVAPFGAFDFGGLDVPAKGCTVQVVAINPDGRWVSSTRAVRRLVFPAPNCILIVKHEFKLYWVRNNSVVKAYPIAIGRDGMETPAPSTWKILAKYKTDPGSVYGPRKMRLFRQRGSSYVFTAYGIHGTNQEWVIGTKASHGCIRMYNRDVLELWPQVPLGTLVFIRP